VAVAAVAAGVVVVEVVVGVGHVVAAAFEVVGVAREVVLGVAAAVGLVAVDAVAAVGAEVVDIDLLWLFLISALHVTGSQVEFYSIRYKI